ncbi:MAG: hydantoinase/oxoprolinase family protein, partial [Planctomycetota bacterium]
MFRVCVDTGGTFTDCVVLDDRGRLSEFKAPSTPSDFSQGVIDALQEAASVYAGNMEDFIAQIELIVHGTTVATNALGTRNVGRTAMITTKGFRDIIEMRRALKIETKSMYDAFIPPYDPIVPRYLRFTVDEEIGLTGDIIKPLDESELRDVIEKIRAEKVEALAICFMNSYVNPEHERKAAQICQDALGEAFITCSSDLLPKMGEYERFSTCVVSVCVGHTVARYMNNLEDRLKRAGFKGQLLVMQANQYTQSVSAVTRKPVYLINSGPAAAPAGAAFLSGVIGESNLITIDMGGTTLDASLVGNGKIPLASGQWLGDERLGVKVVDVNSIGAGGGSIAWLDRLGLLRVGPKSAGAEPGPACYGKGGQAPTLTDAAVVLGYIPEDNFWGGKLWLSRDMAEAAVNTIAEPLGLTVERAAQAILTTLNATMADSIASISTRMGYDIRDFSLLSIGGGGALCGAFLAEILGIQKVIVPNFAASFSAWSMFSLDIGRDYVRSYLCRLSEADPDDMNARYQEMIAEALREFEGFGASRQELVVTKYADVRYKGQYHEVEMGLDAEQITQNNIETLAGEFHRKHEALYTFSMPWVPVELRNLRIIAKLKGKKVQLNKIDKGPEDPAGALIRT